MCITDSFKRLKFHSCDECAVRIVVDLFRRAVQRLIDLHHLAGHGAVDFACRLHAFNNGEGGACFHRVAHGGQLNINDVAQRILRGDVLPGQTLVCDAQNGELVITAK